MKLIKILSILFLLVTITHVKTPIAYAQKVDLAVYPPILQITATPAASIKGPITIQNQSENPVDLTIVFRLFKPSPKENGQVEFVPDAENVPSPDPLLFERVQLFDNDHPVSQYTLSVYP